MTNDPANGVTAIVEAGYDAVYDAIPRSPTLWRIWVENAVDGEYPEDFSHISFVTLAELRRIAEYLELDRDARLVDLACGAGGPGLWLANQDGAQLTGVDLSSVAVRQATDRARRLKLSGRARFVKATFAETGLADDSFHGAVSFDALQYAPDKMIAFREAARILRAGGRIAFTAFELDPGRAAKLPVIGLDPVADYSELLERAGFSVTTYEETAGWRTRLTDAYSSVIASQKTLEEEMGPIATTALLSEMTVTLQEEPYRRRVLVLAQLH